MAFGKDMSNSKTIKESIVANNSKTWWDRLNQATDNLSYMTLGVVDGIVDTIIVEPIKMVTEFLDWGLNIFDEEMYKHNQTQRNNLYNELESIIDNSLSDEQAYYYYCGTFGGKASDLIVGGIYAIQGLTGVINGISTTEGGVKVLQVTLDSGDEAVAMLSSNADDVVMLAPKLKGSVEPNKLHHIFDKSAHNLDDFLKIFNNNQEQAYFEILDEVTKYVKANNISGIFKEHLINVHGYEIVINGNVVDDVVKIGTLYIK